jgi:hypothetical protein
LKFQGFLEFLRARLSLLKEPHVLDSDDGLIGKCRDEFDLLIGKRTNFKSVGSTRAAPNLYSGSVRTSEMCPCLAPSLIVHSTLPDNGRVVSGTRKRRGRVQSHPVPRFVSGASITTVVV